VCCSVYALYTGSARVIHCVLFCMLEVVEGDRCLQELLEVVRLVLEIMLCVL